MSYNIYFDIDAKNIDEHFDYVLENKNVSIEKYKNSIQYFIKRKENCILELEVKKKIFDIMTRLLPTMPSLEYVSSTRYSGYLVSPDVINNEKCEVENIKGSKKLYCSLFVYDELTDTKIYYNNKFYYGYIKQQQDQQSLYVCSKPFYSFPNLQEKLDKIIIQMAVDLKLPINSASSNFSYYNELLSKV